MPPGLLGELPVTGNFSAGTATVPIALDFSKAKDNLGGAFSFHLEVSKGRWGTFADLNFIRLETDADFLVGAQTVQGRPPASTTPCSRRGPRMS